MTRSYVDQDLCWFMAVHRDARQAVRCLGELRACYPDARVIVRSDGDRDPLLSTFPDRFGVELHLEDRLLPVEHGGAAVKRMLVLFEERPTDHLVKIDPDSVVQRRFHRLPAGESIFGTLQGRMPEVSIQGGGLGITRGSVRRILESGLLDEPALRHPDRRRGESRYWDVLAARADRCGLASFDWTLGWIASELSIALVEFDEINSRWEEETDNTDGRYALTHPVATRSKA